MQSPNSLSNLDIKRINEIRMARMCRFCLGRDQLTNINSDLELTKRLEPYLLHENDPNFPQFICSACYRMVEIAYRISQLGSNNSRMAEAAAQFAPHVHEQILLTTMDREQQRPEKRKNASAVEKSKRVKVKKQKVQKENRQRCAPNKPVEIVQKRYEPDLRSELLKKSFQAKYDDFRRSDEFLFGELIEIENIPPEIIHKLSMSSKAGRKTAKSVVTTKKIDYNKKL